VREHRGHGLTYDTLNKVRNLETCRDLDCRLVLEYRGQWGEKDVDRLKAITDVNVTNPESPRWQAKMWDRAFTARPGDPRSDTIWLLPPKTEQDWGRR
jgi:hypothetical protein